MFFRDTGMRLLAERDDAKISALASSDIERRGIGRVELRDILLDELVNYGSSCVHWNKTFARYEQLPNGQVRAFFTDNTLEEGDLLVGADGAQSMIRRQYLPHIQRINPQNSCHSWPLQA